MTVALSLNHKVRSISTNWSTAPNRLKFYAFKQTSERGTLAFILVGVVDIMSTVVLVSEEVAFSASVVGDDSPADLEVKVMLVVAEVAAVIILVMALEAIETDEVLVALIPLETVGLVVNVVVRAIVALLVTVVSVGGPRELEAVEAVLAFSVGLALVLSDAELVTTMELVAVVVSAVVTVTVEVILAGVVLVGVAVEVVE